MFALITYSKSTPLKTLKKLFSERFLYQFVCKTNEKFNILYCLSDRSHYRLSYNNLFLPFSE